MADKGGNGWTRRAVLAGIGAATGATALGVAAPAGAVRARQQADDGTPVPKGAKGELAPSSLAPSAQVELRPDLTYVVIPPAAFANDNFLGGRELLPPGAAPSDPAEGAYLSAPLLLPVGSVLREVAVSYTNPSSATAHGMIYKKALFDNYGDALQLLLLPPGPGFSYQKFPFQEVIGGDFSYEVTVHLPEPGQTVSGVLLGYESPAQSFFSLPSSRQYDSRGGAKLQPGEERTIGLGGGAGVPPQARGAVINLTVTETEGAGFVALFPADQAWQGTSSINWFGTGQNLANSLVTPMDASQQVTIRGGASPTHVIVDILGYLR